MIIVENIRNGQVSHDLAQAMALQIWALNHLDKREDYVFPYRVGPAVQIGKFQNVFAEVNQPYLDENNIDLVRRETGGGAIYMEPSQINFVFQMAAEDRLADNFKKIYQPAIAALQELGVDQVTMSGRNDLEIDGHKVSGAAVSVSHGRLYGGYSLLLDTDAEAMAKALRPNLKKLASKGVKSVRRRVTTIRDFLAPVYQDMTGEEFSDFILARLVGVDDLSQAHYYFLNDQEWAQVDQLVAEKFGNWSWNYGQSPDYDYQNDGRFKAGTVEVRLQVNQGYIKAIKIYGDFFGNQEISDLEAALVGHKFDSQGLEAALNTIDLDQYISGLEKTEFINLILGK
ncbi:lipoate--protein ligase [Aerococcus urinaehominis]|uniref:lipoate--protein ligase n=1 Tax=Aerococcus urinaehominis TaxID=128944 RepID=A0A0X8FJW2_9LACT|nr:lipoate--protein ligase [Aerococcus urinaehominis]AMB98673.1 lipoate--protein ligase [Aerococcus urinaehominis]SDL98100.1 lipoate-protein ligase A [Aerococcus urinaehominis]